MDSSVEPVFLTASSPAGRTLLLTEHDVTAAFSVNRDAALTAREAIAERVKEASRWGWRRGLICFVYCWKLGPLALSRDVVRYICTFLRPRRWWDIGSALRNLRTGELRPLPPAPFEEWKVVQHAYDAGEHEMWRWGEKAEQICAFDLQKETWRTVSNQLLRDIHAQALRMYGPEWEYFGMRYVLIGDWMVLCESDPIGHKITLLSCANESRSFIQMPMPEPLFHQRWDWTKVANAGNCLFILGMTRECIVYPSVVPEDAMCWCCYGSDFKRLTNACDCCVVLQVLFLNDVEYGWTMMFPPPVHYASLPDLFVSADGTHLVARGGTKRVMKGERETREDGWVLNLQSASAKWVARSATYLKQPAFAKPDWMEVL